MTTCTSPTDFSDTNSFYFNLSDDILNDRLSVIIKELQIQVTQATNLQRVTGVDQNQHLDKATRALIILQDI
tara:strand:- start:78 stop:293 length:216 start_codon:yes stop_codon:yes gene_type:complete